MPLRTPRYRAPSWSWAVTNESVVFDSSPLTVVLEVQGVDSRVALLDKSNPYGEIIASILVVEGLIMPLSRCDLLMTGPYGGVGDDSVGFVMFDEPERGKDREGIPNLYIMQHRYVQCLLALRLEFGEPEDWKIDTNLISTTQYTVLIIQRNSDGARALMLRHVKGRADNTYERVGWVCIHGNAGEIQNWDCSCSRRLELI